MGLAEIAVKLTGPEQGFDLFGGSICWGQMAWELKVQLHYETFRLVCQAISGPDATLC